MISYVLAIYTQTSLLLSAPHTLPHPSIATTGVSVEVFSSDTRLNDRANIVRLSRLAFSTFLSVVEMHRIFVGAYVPIFNLT